MLHPTHYTICIEKNGALILIMSIEEFESKGGLTQPWGSNWKPINAESEAQAKEKALKFYTKIIPNARLGGRGVK